MKRLIWGVIILASMTFGTGVVWSESALTPVQEQVYQSTFQLHDWLLDQPLGTAICVSVQPPLFITCAHIAPVNQDKILNMRFRLIHPDWGGLRHSVSMRVVKRNEKNDLLLLTPVFKINKTLKALSLNTEDLRLNDELFTFGLVNLWGRDSIRKGKFLGSTQASWIFGGLGYPFDFSCGQLGIRIKGGYSGGPVANEQGELVGMIFGKDLNFDIGYFIKAQDIAAFLQEVLGNECSSGNS